MHCVRSVLLTGLLLLAAATPLLAQDYIYVVEADLTLASGTDAAGLVGSHVQVVVTFQPAQQVATGGGPSPSFYYTQYVPTSLTYTFTGTQGGLNNGVLTGNAGVWAIRNQHTDTTNDFIELGGSQLPLIGGPVKPSLQVFFPNQNTPPTTPAPLFAYTIGAVDYVNGAFTIGNFPSQVARYGFANASSYGGLDAVSVERTAWGAVKSSFR